MTRPSSERDGDCICDYNPSTTDGPQEDCPFHGRPYAYWIERGDDLARRLDEVARERDVLREAARLEPAENMALTVAWHQVERGEHPMGNVAAVCVMALERVRRAALTATEESA